MLFDSDLAALYGVTSKRFNEASKRSHERFPDDFVFALTNQEVASLKSQIAISSLRDGGHGGRRKLLQVFTEPDAIMAAMVLNGSRAAQMVFV